MHERFSEETVSIGHFQKDRGLEENRVSRREPTCRTSIDPWNEDLGIRIRQSPQTCSAFHCHASIRSETGSNSVENSCDILCPPSPMSPRRATVLHPQDDFGGQLRALRLQRLMWRKIAHKPARLQDQKTDQNKLQRSLFPFY